MRYYIKDHKGFAKEFLDRKEAEDYLVGKLGCKLQNKDEEGWEVLSPERERKPYKTLFADQGFEFLSLEEIFQKNNIDPTTNVIHSTIIDGKIHMHTDSGEYTIQ